MHATDRAEHTERADDVEENWGGNLRLRGVPVSPGTVAELQELVGGSPRVRPIGTRHSFSAVNDAAGALLIDVRSLPGHVAWSGAHVWVPAGWTYGRVAAALHARGRAVPTMGSLPHISIGGAVATGTHGSGRSARVLATQVSGVEYVDARGRLHTRVREEDPAFGGRVLNLGLLGVTTRLRLDTIPAFEISQRSFVGLPLKNIPAAIDPLMSLGYSVSVFLDWQQDESVQVLVKSIPGTGTAAPGATDLGLIPWTGPARAPDGSPGDNVTVHGRTGPWHLRLPHFRSDRVPSAGREIQSEYFVPLHQATEALDALRTGAARFAAPLIIAELRSVAADDLWISPAHGRDSLGIHFTWKLDEAAAAAAVATVEEILSPFDARPHWGKFHSLPPDSYLPSYPRAGELRQLIAREDPNQVFAAGAAAALIGLAAH